MLRHDNLLITLSRDMMRTDTEQRDAPRAATDKSPALVNLSTKQAAHYLGVSVKWLERSRKIGGGPKYHRLGTKIIIYKRETLDAYMRERECA